ncbi:reverse transcriptase family protein [Proteus mirabilis]|uniref:reverse transcriptase family protein n=1 Tax=Proteus mirabilis TaxID=584 RepID=UPI00234915DC|nr:reverse transcriptase family protein [Proteus mirabilis]MDC6122521.1 reverse transcriptase family protein [Proteus mirabilis]MDC6136241.1 reverse transcriptase family protein [Proteus mirabilis]HEK2789086.1 RNA-directed DNA polymerase [Proteus mirabilis]
MSLQIRHTKKNTVSAINSIDSLCSTLSITRTELETVLTTPDKERYTPSAVEKSDGSIRNVYNPKSSIRKIQRRINRRIFNIYTPTGREKKNPPIIWASYLFGSIPNQFLDEDIEQKDYIACARVHCQSKSLLKVDIKNFFDNVQAIHVENIFSNFFFFSDDVSKALTNICCYEGHLVQGALTSSYLSCLCLYDVEWKIVDRLSRKNLRYTRLVDDITVSSTISNYDFSYAKDIIINMLHEKDLPVNLKKTQQYYTSTTPLTVHGLRVSFSEPRLPSDEAKRIRASVRNIESLASERNYRTTHAYRKDFNRCMGRVNKLKRVNHSQYKNLVNRLLKLLPLPSKKDLERVSISLANLEDDFNKGKHDTYWYWKRYHRVHERINILQRTFVREAIIFRDKTKVIKPSYIQ